MTTYYGSKDKAVQKYCGILKYIEQNYHDLYEAIDSLCLGGLFNPRGRGITFLLPDESSIRKIVSQTYGADPQQAVSAIKSLIIPVYFASPKDLLETKFDIINLAREKIIVDSKSSGDNIVLSDKVKISIDSNFTPLEGRRSMQVFKASGIPKGEPVGEKPKSIMRKPHFTTAKSTATGSADRETLEFYEGAGMFGGADDAGETVSRESLESIKSAGDMATICVAKIVKKASKKNDYTTIFAKGVVAIMEQIKSDKDIYFAALAMLDYTPIVSFFLLKSLCIHGIIPIEDFLIAVKFTKSDHRIKDLPKRYSDLFNESPIKSDVRSAINAKMSDIRKRLLRSAEKPDQAFIIAQITEMYNNPKDTLGYGYEAIYPAKLAKLYNDEPAIKRMHDEFRTLANIAILNYETSPVSIRELISTVVEFSHIGNDSTILLGTSTLSQLSSSVEQFFALCQFICSTFCFYMMVPQSEIETLSGIGNPSQSTPITICYVNWYVKQKKWWQRIGDKKHTFDHLIKPLCCD